MLKIQLYHNIPDWTTIIVMQSEKPYTKLENMILRKCDLMWLGQKNIRLQFSVVICRVLLTTFWRKSWSNPKIIRPIIEKNVMPGLHSRQDSMIQEWEWEGYICFISHALNMFSSCLVALRNMLVNHTEPKKTNVSPCYWRCCEYTLIQFWNRFYKANSKLSTVS